MKKAVFALFVGSTVQAVTSFSGAISGLDKYPTEVLLSLKNPRPSVVNMVIYAFTISCEMLTVLSEGLTDLTRF